MTIKQLSIFIENKGGTLLKVLEMLRDNNISIVVSTLGDTDGFGIYRVICSDTEKAYSVLRDKHINVTLTDVYAIRLAVNKVGAAAEIVELMTNSGVEIKYMYSFLYGGKGIIVLRTEDNTKADEVISTNNLDYLVDIDLKEEN